MKPIHTHTKTLLRCLVILSGILLYSVPSADKSGSEIHYSELAQYGFENNLGDCIDENTPANSDQSKPTFDHTLKETPKQEQITMTQSSLPVLNHGKNPPKPDTKDLFTDRSLRYKSLIHLPKEIRSGLAFRLTFHFVCNFLSLNGDIAINAP